MRSLALLGWVIVASVSHGLADSPTARIYLADERQPPVLERVGTPEGLTTLAIDASGELAAVAVPYGAQNRESTILLYSTAAEEPTRVQVGGIIRDLLFAPDAGSVLGLLHRPAKKREGDTYLIRIDLATAKSRRLAHLPPSARALDYGHDAGALLLAVRNEIRTLTFPDLRSGPLYRVPGENLSVAALQRNGMILVGQATTLLLIDLNDPPDEHKMPIRESLVIPEPALSLASSQDGERVLARLADGTIWSVTFSPLRGEPVGAAMAVAATAPPPQPDGPETAQPEPGSSAAESNDPDAVEPETPPLESSPPAEEVALAAVVGQEAARPAADPAPVPQEAALEPEPPALDTALSENPQVRGRIAGPAATVVESIVLLGPDNILREERRITPRTDGAWQVDGLPPGRYRVQLDAGGGHVLVTEPPFTVLEIKAGESIIAPEIRVLEAL